MWRLYYFYVKPKLPTKVCSPMIWIMSFLLSLNYCMHSKDLPPPMRESDIRILLQYKEFDDLNSFYRKLRNLFIFQKCYTIPIKYTVLFSFKLESDTLIKRIKFDCIKTDIKRKCKMQTFH